MSKHTDATHIGRLIRTSDTSFELSPLITSPRFFIHTHTTWWN